MEERIRSMQREKLIAETTQVDQVSKAEQEVDEPSREDGVMVQMTTNITRKAKKPKLSTRAEVIYWATEELLDMRRQLNRLLAKHMSVGSRLELGSVGFAGTVSPSSFELLQAHAKTVGSSKKHLKDANVFRRRHDELVRSHIHLPRPLEVLVKKYGRGFGEYTYFTIKGIMHLKR